MRINSLQEMTLRMIHHKKNTLMKCSNTQTWPKSLMPSFARPTLAGLTRISLKNSFLIPCPMRSNSIRLGSYISSTPGVGVKHACCWTRRMSTCSSTGWMKPVLSALTYQKKHWIRKKREILLRLVGLIAKNLWILYAIEFWRMIKSFPDSLFCIIRLLMNIEEI